MRLLDADVLIDVLRGYSPAVQWLGTIPREEFGLPGLVVMELLEGCPDMHAVRQLQRLLAPYPVYWPTEQDCERALTMFARSISGPVLASLMRSSANARWGWMFHSSRLT